MGHRDVWIVRRAAADGIDLEKGVENGIMKLKKSKANLEGCTYSPYRP
jgi:hypothetical protein